MSQTNPPLRGTPLSGNNSWPAASIKPNPDKTPRACKLPRGAWDVCQVGDVGRCQQTSPTPPPELRTRQFTPVLNLCELLTFYSFVVILWRFIEQLPQLAIHVSLSIFDYARTIQ
jgi:hypothetical protein